MSFFTANPFRLTDVKMIEKQVFHFNDGTKAKVELQGGGWGEVRMIGPSGDLMIGTSDDRIIGTSFSITNPSTPLRPFGYPQGRILSLSKDSTRAKRTHSLSVARGKLPN
jgi:hypothetical protein